MIRNCDDDLENLKEEGRRRADALPHRPAWKLDESIPLRLARAVDLRHPGVRRALLHAHDHVAAVVRQVERSTLDHLIGEADLPRRGRSANR